MRKGLLTASVLALLMSSNQPHFETEEIRKPRVVVSASPLNYDTIKSTILDLGISVDEEHSYLVPGSEKIVIHVPDRHGYILPEVVEQLHQRKEQDIGNLLTHLPIDALGLESFVDTITPREFSMAQQRYVQSNLSHVQHNQVIAAELEQYVQLLSAHGIQEYENALTNLATGVLNARQPSEEVLDFYVVAFYGKKALFGLEKPDHINIAKSLAMAIFYETVSSNAKILRNVFEQNKKYLQDHPELMVVKEKINTWASVVERELERHWQILRSYGVYQFSEQRFKEYIYEQREQGWAENISSQPGNLFLTVGGKKHSQGYVQQLTQRDISVITLE